MHALSLQHPVAGFSLGPTWVEYTLESDRTVSFLFLPGERRADRAEKRRLLDSPEIAPLAGMIPLDARRADPLVALHVRGEGLDFSPVDGFGHGLTLRGGEASYALKFERQEIHAEPGGLTIKTHLEAKEGFGATHSVQWVDDAPFLRMWTEFYNRSNRPLTLDLLASFSFSGVTPFHSADAPGRLRLHRIRAGWSAEGRIESRSLESLHLERTWTGHGVVCERFGTRGSMPVQAFFPFVALEDTVAGVTWAAQTNLASSWQIEVFRRGDDVCVSGGIADREFGHWWKTVASGESFRAPPATLATVSGDLQDACAALTAAQDAAADAQPASERALPAVFNEWCSSWGHPDHGNLIALARRLRGLGFTYLVIDYGWAENPSGGFIQSGDWVVNAKAFPDGLRATCEAIRAEGLTPGLWFEFEVCNPGSRAWDLIDHHLRRDGRVLRVGTRRFWDFRDPWTAAYLREKVIGLLRDTGCGYLKVDYNETLGPGVDGPCGNSEGPGEHLRAHIEAVQAFFREIRRELPDLVIENCSSGGHRLEPSMQALCAMGSFSDAHETRDIPIIAAHLHHAILPRQSQVWAVLRKGDDGRRLDYSLAAAFLGRVGVSGDAAALEDGQLARVREALELYRLVAPAIARGRSRLFSHTGESWQHPEGWQALRRTAADGRSILCVIHTFARPAPDTLIVPLPEGRWVVARSFGAAALGAQVCDGVLTIPSPGEFAGGVVWLQR